MIKDISRRKAAAVLLGVPVAAQAQAASEKDPLAEAREQVGKTIAKLDEVDLPMATEPAFVFRP